MSEASNQNRNVATPFNQEHNNQHTPESGLYVAINPLIPQVSGFKDTQAALRYQEAHYNKYITQCTNAGVKPIPCLPITDHLSMRIIMDTLHAVSEHVDDYVLTEEYLEYLENWPSWVGKLSMLHDSNNTLLLKQLQQYHGALLFFRGMVHSMRTELETKEEEKNEGGTQKNEDKRRIEQLLELQATTRKLLNQKEMLLGEATKQTGQALSLFERAQQKIDEQKRSLKKAKIQAEDASRMLQRANERLALANSNTREIELRLETAERKARKAEKAAKLYQRRLRYVLQSLDPALRRTLALNLYSSGEEVPELDDAMDWHHGSRSDGAVRISRKI
jgi:hypothetical protein